MTSTLPRPGYISSEPGFAFTYSSLLREESSLPTRFSHLGRYSPGLNKSDVNSPAHYPGDRTNPLSNPHSCLGLSRIGSPLSSSGSRDDPAGDPTGLIPRGADKGGPVTRSAVAPSPARPRAASTRLREKRTDTSSIALCCGLYLCPPSVSIYPEGSGTNVTLPSSSGCRSPPEDPTSCVCHPLLT